jgi:hypothetical protein
VERERQLPSHFQQIERQLVQLLFFGTQDHYQIRVLTLIPQTAVLRFVGEAKRYRIIERDEVEAPLTNGRQHPFLGEQTIRVSYQCQP